jgi:hypothetical protein
MIQLPEKYGKENFDVSSKALGREGRLTSRGQLYKKVIKLNYS